MLFSSSDGRQIDRLRHKLAEVGIPCEIRPDDAAEAAPDLAGYPALWVRDDQNFSAALMLFASWYRQQALRNRG